MFGNTTGFHGFSSDRRGARQSQVAALHLSGGFPHLTPSKRLFFIGKVPFEVSNHDCLGEYSPKQTRGFIMVYSSPRPQCTPKKTWVDHLQKNNKNSAKNVIPRRPKPFLRCGFPHVPQLALPGPWVVGPDVGAQPPDAAQLRGDLFAQKPGRKAMGKHRGNTVTLEG